MKSPEWIGWASSFVLLATIARQVYTQWKTKSDVGVSRWLFVGQLTASTGFTIYSLLLRNWVYVFSNVALLATAVVGELIYLRNKRRAVIPERESARDASRAGVPPAPPRRWR